MSKWEMVRLGEVFSLIRNGASIKQGIVDGGYPITRIETIANSEVDRNRMGYAGIQDITKYESYVLQTGDILMSHINSEKHLGKTAIYEKQNDEIIIHGMNLLCLRPVAHLLNYRYGHYYFRSQRFKRMIPGITKKSVNQASFTVTALKNLEIPLPPLEVQQQMVSTLDAAFELLKLRKQQLAELDVLIKSVFYEMFGDPVTNEKEWIKYPLSEVVSINPRKTELDSVDDNLEVSFVGMADVSSDGVVEVSNIKKYQQVKKGFTYFYENDVLFAKITPCMENGKGGIAKNLMNSIGFGSTEFHVLRPIDNLSNSEWIYHLTSLTDFRIIAEKNMTGSAGQKRVPTNFFSKFMVPLPPFELQNQFAGIVTKIEEQKAQVKQAIDETQQLFDSLMSRNFDN
ncbi:restriction endonuclease subunit S [Paenibacillus dakarensis]|uniref:restriction endonuclease subunit S n=1 Tax=Paenibacillus dakarensis TaxID=1527293 RepID=UPI0006D567AD|nr:restriction endonuclease subunit S [Paenibacillus dakarensis]